MSKFTKEELIELETIADAARLCWLLEKGLAWNGCYDEDWLGNEWLYYMQNARGVIDAAMAKDRDKSNKGDL